MKSGSNESNLLLSIFKAFLPSDVSFHPVLIKDFWTKFEDRFREYTGLTEIIRSTRPKKCSSPKPGYICWGIVPYSTDLDPVLVIRTEPGSVEQTEEGVYEVLGTIFLDVSAKNKVLWSKKSESLNSLVREKDGPPDRPKESFEEVIIRVKQRPVVLLEKHKNLWIGFPLFRIRERFEIEFLGSYFPIKFHTDPEREFSFVGLDLALVYPKTQVGWVHRDFLNFLRTLSFYRYS